MQIRSAAGGIFMRATQIKLANGRGFAVIDEADLPIVQSFTWYAHVTPHDVYAATKIQDADGKRRTVLMHRLLLPEVDRIDHADGDGLNNQRTNLRAASHAQNMQNRAVQKRTLSGFKGVYWHRYSGKWRVQIVAFGRRVQQSGFANEIEAAKAYDQLARQMHGEFAVTNFKEAV